MDKDFFAVFAIDSVILDAMSDSLSAFFGCGRLELHGEREFGSDVSLSEHEKGPRILVAQLGGATLIFPSRDALESLDLRRASLDGKSAGFVSSPRGAVARLYEDLKPRGLAFDPVDGEAVRMPSGNADPGTDARATGASFIRRVSGFDPFEIPPYTKVKAYRILEEAPAFGASDQALFSRGSNLLWGEAKFEMYPTDAELAKSASSTKTAASDPAASMETAPTTPFIEPQKALSPTAARVNALRNVPTAPSTSYASNSTSESASRSWRRGPVGIALAIIGVILGLLRICSRTGGTSYSSGSYYNGRNATEIVDKLHYETFDNLLQKDYEMWAFADKVYLLPFGDFTGILPEWVLATLGEPISSSDDSIEYEGLKFTFAHFDGWEDDKQVKSVALTGGDWLIDGKYGIGSSYEEFKAAMDASEGDLAYPEIGGTRYGDLLAPKSDFQFIYGYINVDVEDGLIKAVRWTYTW
jgi:hypothetical protein